MYVDCKKKRRKPHTFTPEQNQFFGDIYLFLSFLGCFSLAFLNILFFVAFFLFFCSLFCQFLRGLLIH